MKFKCPKCGGENVFLDTTSPKGSYLCPDCHENLRTEEVVAVTDKPQTFSASVSPQQNPNNSAQCYRCSCGSWQPQGTTICSNCGATLVYIRNNPVPQQSSNGAGVASLVLGIISLFCFGFIAGLAAIICGAISMHNKDDSNGTAVAGIILGIIGFVGWIIIIIAFPGAFNY